MPSPVTGPLVVVGGGLAGGKAVEAVRESGYDGELVLVFDEPHLPYERPPLSKDYLQGKAEFDDALVHDEEWYAAHDVTLRRGVRATGINLAAHRLLLGDDEQPYARLLLATGSQPRRLPLAEGAGPAVKYLRTRDDSDRLKDVLTEGSRVVIIGAGWIGLEVAAAARLAGASVTVVESLSLPLLRVLGPEVAAIFAGVHRHHGVDLRLDASVAAVEKDGAGAVVRLADGAVLEADVVVVGIGVAPDVSLAEAAGLEVDNGILVDEQLRTSDPDVFAAGDVANELHPLLGRRIRVEHWDTAAEQGSVAGRNLAGAEEVYDRLPYFFTDQYDLGMEYVGSIPPEGYDAVVVRGDSPTGAEPFTAFWLAGDLVLAGMHANDWDAIDAVQAMVGRQVDVDRLRDATVPLSDLGPADA